MWSNLRLSSNILQVPKYCTNWSRTVFVLERVVPPKLNKLRSNFQKKLNQENFIYKLVEDTDVKKKPDLDLILMKDVPGIGLKGENVKINCYIGYRDLLLPKLAVYADSDEAQSLNKVKDESQLSSKYSKVIEKYIIGRPLGIALHPENSWVLEPWHVKYALRRIGITANDDCIDLPKKKISGPNVEVENKDFIVNLIMNKSEKFPIRCRIYLVNSLKTANLEFKLYTISEALFPEQQEEVDYLMKIENDVQMRQKIVVDTQDKGKKKIKRKKKELYAPVGAFNKHY